MIDASYLDRGYSSVASEPRYAQFHGDGQLKSFRSESGGKLIALHLERGALRGRIEKIEITRSPSRRDVEDSGETEEAEFDFWVREAIRSIYELTEFVRRCDFCGKTDAEVATLIAGPTAYICDECIATCNTILEDNRSQAEE